jgi:hypothetical protein
MSDKADKKAKAAPTGTTAEISEGQPDLDVDALMVVVEDHWQSTAGEVEAPPPPEGGEGEGATTKAPKQSQTQS